jgi:hypothetical protein
MFLVQIRGSQDDHFRLGLALKSRYSFKVTVAFKVTVSFLRRLYLGRKILSQTPKWLIGQTTITWPPLKIGDRITLNLTHTYWHSGSGASVLAHWLIYAVNVVNVWGIMLRSNGRWDGILALGQTVVPGGERINTSLARLHNHIIPLFSAGCLAKRELISCLINRNYICVGMTDGNHEQVATMRNNDTRTWG